MAFTGLDKLLEKSLNRHGISDQVHEGLAVGKFEEIKETFFGHDLAGLMRPLYLKWGNLMVACLDERASFAIEEKQEIVINILNAEIGSQVIKRIKCLL